MRVQMTVTDARGDRPIVLMRMVLIVGVPMVVSDLVVVVRVLVALGEV